jgi:hypothetical protein
MNHVLERLEHGDIPSRVVLDLGTWLKGAEFYLARR